MLAKAVNDNAPILDERGAWEFFASKLAPTRRKGSSQPAEHFLGFAFLTVIALLEYFGEDIARAVGIAHVDVGLGQVELGCHFISTGEEVEFKTRPQLALESYLDALLQDATAEELPEPLLVLEPVVEPPATLDEFQLAVLEEQARDAQVVVPITPVVVAPVAPVVVAPVVEVHLPPPRSPPPSPPAPTSLSCSTA